MTSVKNRQIIDSHCHLQMSQYDADRDQVIRRALDSGVHMVCVGVDLDSSRKAIALAEQYEGVWASVGLHPNDNLDEVYKQSEYQPLVSHPKVVAVGEIGLDYYRTIDPNKRSFQKKRFQEQLMMSDKPRIIHCREAHDDMLAILPDVPGVIHSFTGTVEQALQYIEKGFHIGLNGIITFTHQYDEIVRKIPLERILLETDAPYLAPAPYRGKRNEPGHISHVAARIAILRGIKTEDLIGATTKNAEGLFRV